MLTMSATDFLKRWFESDRLIAALSVSGIIGTFQGVASPGTAYVLLHHYMGEIDGSYRAWGFCRGGTGAVSEALASAAKSFGAVIRTQCPVQEILVQDGRAIGVVLENGEEIKAAQVVSGLDPHRTFKKLVPKGQLDSEFLDQVSRFRMRGSSAKVNLSLDGLPEFACRPGSGPHLRGDITICPSVNYLEKAFDEAILGNFSRRPFLDVMIPSLIDPSLAPPGHHVMSIFVQYAPYDLSTGPESWPRYREALGDAVLATLEEFAPGISSKVLHRQVLTPWDLEQTFGLTEGNIFHGELSLEQLLFQRPMSGWARHRTPIAGLWMCGSGTHPGGGIMGAPGRNTAMLMVGQGGQR
jgi:phytoene dehydrogenase-like protein